MNRRREAETARGSETRAALALAVEEGRESRSKKPLPIRVGSCEVGLGVFATRKIRRNTVLGMVEGEVIDDGDYSSDYCMDLGGNLSLEPASPYRYINHSCEPNCSLFQYEDPPESVPCEFRRLWIEVIRDIEPGEQLTIDYGWPADSAIPCMCGSNGCRGWVVDESELAIVLSRAVRRSAK